MDIILQAIKLAPRFLFQIYIQPLKLYDFVKADKSHGYIYGLSTIIQGLFLGLILAVPYYLWYGNIEHSIFFAFVVAVVVAVAFVGAFAGAGVFEDARAFAGAFAGGVFVGAVTFAVGVAVKIADAFEFEVAIKFAFVDAFAGAIAGAFAGAGAIAGVFKIWRRIVILFFFFNPLILIYLLAYTKEFHRVNNFELLFPIAFLVVYTFLTSFLFAENISNQKTKPGITLLKYDDLIRIPFIKIQKLSLFWGPVFSLFACLPIYFNGNPRAFYFSIGFLIIPFFVLHIPDSLLCLPVWRSQRNKILEAQGNLKEMTHFYENSLLFKHEMIFLQLPGLDKVITAMASNSKQGMKEAVKHLSHLHQFTFQQEQALAALTKLWKEKENEHLLIHYLLEAKGVPVLEQLSQNERLPELYLEFFEDENESQPSLPGDFAKQLSQVCMNMAALEGYPLNDGMVNSIEAACKLLAAGSVKDLFGAVGIFRKATIYPDELDYFKAIKKISYELIIIKNNLQKVNDIVGFEAKRSALSDEKEQLLSLSSDTIANLYEPFATIWQKALNHCAELVEKEIEILHGTAIFDIRLLNHELLIFLPPVARDFFEKPPPDPATLFTKQDLHFDISNKGQELGRNVSVTMQTDNHTLTLIDNKPKEFTYFEPGKIQRITFPVTLSSHGKSTVKLLLTYSDKTRENKQEHYSFPVTITEKRTQFKKIPNPYIAGPALRSDSTLFMGRDDIYRYIDQNINPTGQHHTIVCHGQRRTGKSSLLYRIENQGFTQPRLQPINIDLQGISDERDFYLTLSEAILKKLRLTGQTPAGDFGGFKRLIKEIAPLSGNKIIVLMLDEFEELQMRVEDKRISRTVFSNLRHVMQYEDNVIFLFCGTHKIEEMSAEYWSIFFNTALYCRVGRLPREDAVRLIREPVKDYLNYDELAVEQILAMTGCQPYLVQLLCRCIVSDLNNYKKRNDVLVNDVDDAVERIIDEDNDNFSKEAWKGAGHLDRMILSAAAEELTQKVLEWVRRDDLLDKVLPLVRDVSRENAVDVLDKLVTGEILMEKGLSYGFTVNMTRRWIASRHPLRKVRR